MLGIAELSFDSRSTACNTYIHTERAEKERASAITFPNVNTYLMPTAMNTHIERVDQKQANAQKK